MYYGQVSLKHGHEVLAVKLRWDGVHLRHASVLHRMQCKTYSKNFVSSAEIYKLIKLFLFVINIFLLCNANLSTLAADAALIWDVCDFFF